LCNQSASLIINMLESGNAQAAELPTEPPGIRVLEPVSSPAAPVTTSAISAPNSGCSQSWVQPGPYCRVT